MKRQVSAQILTSSQVVTKLRTDDKVGTGLRRGQDDRPAFYPPDGTDTADFVDGGRGENPALTPVVELSFEERRAGKSLCHDGERRSNALTHRHSG